MTVLLFCQQCNTCFFFAVCAFPHHIGAFDQLTHVQAEVLVQNLHGLLLVRYMCFSPFRCVDHPGQGLQLHLATSSTLRALSDQRKGRRVTRGASRGRLYLADARGARAKTHLVGRRLRGTQCIATYSAHGPCCISCKKCLATEQFVTAQ